MGRVGAGPHMRGWDRNPMPGRSGSFGPATSSPGSLAHGRRTSATRHSTRRANCAGGEMVAEMHDHLATWGEEEVN